MGFSSRLKPTISGGHDLFRETSFGKIRRVPHSKLTHLETPINRLFPDYAFRILPRQAEATMLTMKYWEVIADKLSAAGWTWDYCSAVTRHGWRWVVDAHRGDGRAT